MQALKVGVLGITGRMGTMIKHIIEDQTDLELVGGTSSKDDAESTGALFDKANILIDFTGAETVSAHLTLARDHKKPLMMGTTGLSENDFKVLEETSKIVPCLYAANTSIGITLLLHLIEQASTTLDERFDIEIRDVHHRHKKDAPSGTALALGKAAARGRGRDFDEIKQLNWTTPITRQKGQIGFSAERGGEVISDHTVSFYGEDEIISLRHHAQNRMIYAKGAVEAAMWLVAKQPGLYSMRDVLGI